ncbi:MAG: hypothetical protein N2485_08350 [bacterium]|nr:hypothetical protein [bacterium]
MKLASIFDPPKKTLCPDIFGPNNKLYSYVRKQILDLVYQLIPKENVKSIALIGTAVGYQWSEDSDVDVNVVVNPPELLTEELNNKRHALNEKNNYISGTKHIINIFLSPWHENQSWQDNIFGVYDVLKDEWISFPSKDIRNPQEEYFLNLIYSKLIFKNYIENLKKYLYSLKQLISLRSVYNLDFPQLHNLYIERKNKEVLDRKLKLLNFIKSLDSSRKFDYYYGWGLPRKNYRNLIYKFIEHESKDLGVDDYFDYFRELRLREGEKIPWEYKIIN